MGGFIERVESQVIAKTLIARASAPSANQFSFIVAIDRCLFDDLKKIIITK